MTQYKKGQLIFVGYELEYIKKNLKVNDLTMKDVSLRIDDYPNSDRYLLYSLKDLKINKKFSLF